ncbi:RAP domain-containing protein [Skeletonema marinoi]|uniref:RAP domain-containing protein n=1 Tax=Skeletonema marinoi TaxID=267567 RepID=A0AAD9D515_9STRA|nr:RAP domain-containing protein [Skeletonema marinoi]
MSGQSYSYYMRPQDRDGSNHAHATGRGRSQHLAPSRGRSRERSYDRMSHHRDNRDMRVEASYQYHRSRSSDYAPHSRGHRSRSFDLHPFPYNYSSSSNNSSQRDSSYHDNSSRKRSRSPSRPNQRNLQNNEYDRPRSQRSFGDGRPKDTRYERRPLGPTNGNGAEMHRAPANEFHRNKNAENYANASYGSDMNNMNNYHSNYYQPPSRYDHPKNSSHERRPLSSRQDFSSNPTQRNSTHLFNNTHTIHDLIQIAFANLATLKPSLTAAFWNKVSKQMSGRNASNSRLPRHHDELGDHLNQIFEHTQNTLSLFGPKDLSQAIYSIAKITDTLRKYGDGGRRSARGDDIIDVLSSLLMNSDMTPNKELFLSFACASRDKLDRFDARGLSNVAYAYALIGYVPEFDDESNLVDQIATQAAHRSAEFNAQGISNMMWAYATVDKPHALLFQAMADQIAAYEHLGEFKSQEISNTVWAYAKAGISHPKLFEKVANHVARIDVLYGFKPQELSNIVWAFATAGVRHQKLFEKVANCIVGQDNLDRFIPQELSNIMWAYAKAGSNDPELFEKVANHIVASDKMDQFNTQQFSNIVWAYATAQFPHPKLFKKVADAAIRSKGKFISQEVANLLWAYATMGDINMQLFLSFASTAAKLIDSCNNQHLANIAWAYAVADVDAPSLFNIHFINKCVEKKNAFKHEELTQLHQWHLWQTVEKAHPGLPLDLQEACYNEFISEEPTVSKLQEDVVAQLSHIGLDPKEEVLMGSGYRIDALVEVNGKTICIEVDGPSHFIGRSKSPLARTILKRRQVPLIDGIELVSVPYWEWDKLGKDAVKKQEYLRRLLGL